MNWLRNIAKQREFMIFMIVTALFIFMTFASPYFLTVPNLLAVLLGLSLEAIIAVAMTHLMVSGGFDMSVGSVVAFTGAMTAMLLRAGAPVPVAVLIGLIIGGSIGLFNGFIVAKVGINPFVTTLSSLSLFRGLTLIVTRGQNITGLPKSFKLIGQAKLIGIQTPIIIAVVWGTFAVPDDPSRSGAAPIVVAGFVRLAIELVGDNSYPINRIRDRLSYFWVVYGFALSVKPQILNVGARKFFDF